MHSQNSRMKRRRVEGAPQMICAMLAILSLLSTRSAASAVFLSPLSVAGQTFHAVAIDEPNEQAAAFQPRVGGLVEGLPINHPSESATNYSGCWFSVSIFMDDSERAVYFRRWNSLGAVGAIHATNLADSAVLGIMDKYSTDAETSNYPTDFPIVVIYKSTAAQLRGLLHNGDLVVLNISSEKDPWWPARKGLFLGLFIASLAPISFINLVLASIKLYKFIRYSSSILSVATLTLSVEILANIVRLIFLVFDPLWAYGTLGRIGTQVCATLHIPFSLTTSLLICLYWYELSSKAKVLVLSEKVAFLNRLRIPFAVLVVILFAIELSTSIPRGIPQVDIGFMSIIGGVINLLLILSTSIFFLWNGFRILKFFSNTAPATMSQRHKRLMRATKLIISTGFISILIILGVILPITPIFWTPTGFVLCWFCMYLGFSIASFMKILAFTAPSANKGPSESPEDHNLSEKAAPESKKESERLGDETNSTK